MSIRDDKLLWCPPAVVRLCVVLGAAAFFFGISMIIEPRFSRAASDRVPARIVSDDASTLLNPDDAIGGTPRRVTSLNPASVYANQPMPANPLDYRKPPAQDEQGNVLLGSLIGASDAVIWVYSGRTGPIYTVVHKQRGVLALGLDENDLYHQFPNLEFDQLKMAPFNLGSQQLMLADPAKQEP
jgi:hypothetical protein